MRNIYDIITEQRSIIDVNIASYDLDHTICCLNNNEYYLQEGLGESVKNGASKVIEFIKQLIVKIRELIRKMINFLIGGKKPAVTMKDIKNGKVGTAKENDNKENVDKEKKPATGSNANETESNVYDKNIHKGKDPSSLSEQDILAGSLRTVNIIQYVGFDVKERITDAFFSAVNSVTRNHTADYNEAGKLFMNSIEKTCFKGAGKQAKGKPVVERIKLELNEPSEPVQTKVRDLKASVIMTYIEADMKYGARDEQDRGKGINSFLTNTEEEATKNLKELEAKLKGLNANGGNVDESSFTNIQKVLTMVGAFINFITTNVFKAYNALYAVFEQAMMDYVKAYHIQI